MTDRKPDALAPSSPPGALRKARPGALVRRGRADVQRLDVVFPDKNLEAAVRAELHEPDGSLTRGTSRAWRILDAERRGISDLTGLER